MNFSLAKEKLTIHYNNLCIFWFFGSCHHPKMIELRYEPCKYDKFCANFRDPSRYVQKNIITRNFSFSQLWFDSGYNPKIFAEKVDSLCRQWYNEANYRLNGYCQQCVNCQKDLCLLQLDVPHYKDLQYPCNCPSYFKRMEDQDLKTLTYQFFDHLKEKPVFTVDLPNDLNVIL